MFLGRIPFRTGHFAPCIINDSLFEQPHTRTVTKATSPCLRRQDVLVTPLARPQNQDGEEEAERAKGTTSSSQHGLPHVSLGNRTSSDVPRTWAWSSFTKTRLLESERGPQTQGTHLPDGVMAAHTSRLKECSHKTEKLLGSFCGLNRIWGLNLSRQHLRRKLQANFV